MATTRTSYASIYIIGTVAVGIIVGALFGYLFDGVITGRRTLSVLAALVAVVSESAIRRYALARLPGLFGQQGPSRTSLPLLFIAFVIALAGGLATHDIGLVFNMMYGPMLGAFSGLFASLMTAVLVVLREEERREVRPH